MDWNVLAPAIFSLAGVAIGTLGSLAVGFYSTRTSREQTRAQHAAAARAERKDLILEYLRAMQVFHDFIGNVWENAPYFPVGSERDREAARLDTDMWFHQKKLLLVANEPLRIASVALSDALNRALYGDRPADTDFYDSIDGVQLAFLEAARVELGIPEVARGAGNARTPTPTT